MIIEDEKRTFEASEGLTQKGFTIAASSKAFEILSSSLYKDKILAIIREISCNAYDAHVAAGKPQEPIQIHLPTSLEPWFSVLDNGPGLSHEDVINLYSTYFASTKATSNDYIGAFGLGSKSPFSYVDAFTVTSRHDGKKRIYTAFKNEQGMPSITLMHEEDTTDINGFEVQIPVKASDNREFYMKSESFYRYFTPTPIFNTPMKLLTDAKNAIEIAGVKFLGIYYDAATFNLVQGNVVYPVELKQFPVGLFSNSSRSYHSLSSAVINVPIGTFEVTASREGISYTPATIASITALVKKKQLDIIKEIEDKFDTFASYYEAYQYKKKLNDTFHRNVLVDISDSIFKYKGKELIWPDLSPSNTDKRFTGVRHIGSSSNFSTIQGRRSIGVSYYHSISENEIKSIKYFINDVSTSQLIPTIINNKDKFNSFSENIILEGSDPEAYIREKLADFSPELKLEFVKLSSLPTIIPIPKPKLKPFIVKAVKFTDYCSNGSTQTLLDFDISKGCKYLIGRYRYGKLEPTDKKFKNSTYTYNSSVRDLVELNAHIKLFDLDNLYIISNRHLKKLLKYANVCTDFEEEFNKRLDELTNDKDLKDYSVKKTNSNRMYCDNCLTAIILSKKDINSNAKVALDTITYYENAKPVVDVILDKKIEFVSMYNRNAFSVPNKYTGGYVDEKVRTKFYETYPLLSYIPNVSSRVNEKDIVGYINLIQK